jgi:lipopolysaccharide export system protein LptC
MKAENATVAPAPGARHLSSARESALVSVAEPTIRRYVLPWYQRMLSGLSAYLPLILMALVALATWWLVKNTPVFQGAKPAAALRHIPDYTMRNFKVQRFAADGSLRLQIEGDEARHYPDTDTLEIDQARIRSITPDSGVTVATAQKAISNGDGSEVQLNGQAHVVREASKVGDKTLEAIDFRSEFLHAFLQTEQVKSHLPVTITRGTVKIQGASMDYDNLSRVALFKGSVKATFSPGGQGR